MKCTFWEKLWCSVLKGLWEFLVGPSNLDDRFTRPENAKNQVEAIVDPVLRNVLISDPTHVIAGDVRESDLIDIWNSFATTSEQLNNRRHTSNAFYATISAALIAGLAQLWINMGDSLSTITFWSMTPFCFIAIIGIRMNSIWISLIEHYALVSFSKVQIMRAIEERMRLRVYSAQYAIVKLDENKFKGFNSLEIKFPYLARTACIVALIGVFVRYQMHPGGWHWHFSIH